ncbi:zinc ribbon domain-containing protein [Brevibacterium samyangense]|uniref:CT398-like coiled coil hairpin domain-containing protein n=1 Tax=Brevibacterium samyangense TaxID=366888 RepID=A0ABN2TH47_9MICO
MSGTVLDTDGHTALLAWIDLSARLRRNAADAGQKDLLERLRALAGEHKARTAAIERSEAEREAAGVRAAAVQGDLDARGARITEMEAALHSGEGLTSKDLVALQADIAVAREKLEALEEEELGVMEEIETLEASITEARSALAEVASRGRELQAERTRTAERLTQEAEAFRTERGAVESRIPEPLVARLRRREAEGSIPAAELRGGACGACGEMLSAVQADAVRGAAPGTVFECETCEAVLVTTV